MTDSTPKYTILPKQCIDLWVESVGISKLNDDAGDVLTEDVSFRIRECVHNALRIMKHCRRNCLTTEDFNNALKECNTEVIYGHGGIENLGFKSVSFKDGRLCYIEEKEINLRELALESATPIDPGEVSVKTNWLVLEGNQCSTSKKNSDYKTILKEPISSYLTNVTSALIGKSAHLRKIALKDLMVNKKLQVVLPHLVSFFSSQIKHHTGLDSFTLVASYILLSINALVENQSILLVPYVFQLVKIMLFIVEAQMPVSKWLIKDKAAHVLAHLCRKQNLHNQLLKSYQDSLSDNMRPLSYTYGAVVGVRILGVDAIANVLYPIMREKLKVFAEKCSNAECEQEITELAALRTAYARAASLLFSQNSSMDLLVKYSSDKGITYTELYEELGEEFLNYCSKTNHECSANVVTKLGSLQKGSNLLNLNKPSTVVTQLINNKLQILKACDQIKPVSTESYVVTRIILNDIVSCLTSKRKKVTQPHSVFQNDEERERNGGRKKRKTTSETTFVDKRFKGTHPSYKHKHNHSKDISKISNVLPIL